MPSRVPQIIMQTVNEWMTEEDALERMLREVVVA
jgi:hypothetical protein